MSIWKNRPLFVVACVMMIGTLISGLLASDIKRWLICLVGLTIGIWGTVFLWRVCRKSKARGGVVLLSLVCLGISLVSSYMTFDVPQKQVCPYIGKECTVRATVAQRRSAGESFSSYVLRLDEVDGQDVSGNAVLTCYYLADLDVGDVISLQAQVVSAKEASGGIYQSYQLLGDGIFAGVISDDDSQMEMLQEGEPSFLHTLETHRQGVAERLKNTLGKDTAGVVSALLLGERGHLAHETRRDFARCGVSHLLAISGLHMTILFGSLAWLLKLCFVPPKMRAVLLGLLASAYLLYLGFPPSATRAVIMLGMTYLSTLFGRKSDALTSLGVAGMGILLVSPTAVFDVGFWLSFSATFGLLTLLPWIKFAGAYRYRPLVKLGKGLLAGVVAVSVSLWITSFVFGEISLFSAPMTLLLTPFVGVLLFLTAIYLVIQPFVPVYGLGKVISALTDGMEAICQWAADSPYALISLRETWVPVLAILMMIATLILLGLSLSSKKKWLVLTPMVVGWVILLVGLGVTRYAQRNVVQVGYVAPSSVADMIVYTHGQSAVICDFSNGSNKSVRSACEQMAEQGATEVSAMIVTHYHNATISSLTWLMENEKVRMLYLPPPLDTEDAYIMRSCLDKAKETQTPIICYDYDQNLSLWKSCHVTVSQAWIKRSVQPVLLMTMTTPTQQMAYVGGGTLESPLVDEAKAVLVQSQFVIFGHHGPKTKQSFDCSFSDDVQLLCLADEKMTVYLPSEGMIDASYVHIGNCQFDMDMGSRKDGENG